MDAIAQRDYAAPLSTIDEVVCCELQQVVTRRRLRADDAVFAGHYPHDPVFPGVLMVEAVVQACRVWADRHGCRLRLRELGSIRFLAALRPGDLFELDCRLSRPDAEQRVRVDARITKLDEHERVSACVCRLEMECTQP